MVLHRILFALSLLALLSCSSTKNQTIDLSIGEDYTVEENLVITFLNVTEDSRCPINVECIWEGRAVVELRLVHQLDMVTVLTLIAHAGNEEESEATYANYFFKLLAVHPYPEAPNSIETEDYSIELRIEELEE